MKTLYNIFILIIILGSLVLSIFAIYREDYVVSILMIGIAFVSAFMLSDLGNKIYHFLIPKRNYYTFKHDIWSKDDNSKQLATKGEKVQVLDVFDDETYPHNIKVQVKHKDGKIHCYAVGCFERIDKI